MKRSKSIVLLLVLLLVILGSNLLLRQLTPETAIENNENEPMIVAAIDKDDVATLSWSNEEGTFTLIKTDDQWQYTDDINLRVEQSIPETMLSAISSVTASFKISEPEDLNEYGLEPPSLTITVTTEDGQASSFTIGDKNSLTGEYYLQYSRDEKTVWLVNSSLVNAFSYNPEQTQ